MEALVINPRRRRSRRKRATRGRRRRRRVRRNPHLFTSNPRRRRRGGYRARRRGRARRNPRGSRPFKVPGLSVDVGAALIAAGGAIGSEMATGFVGNMLPEAWKSGPQAPLVRVGLKLGVGAIALPMLLRATVGSRVANLVALGATMSAAIDAYRTWVSPMIPGLSAYELGEYQLGDMYASEVSEVSGLGAEGMYAGNLYE